MPNPHYRAFTIIMMPTTKVIRRFRDDPSSGECLACGAKGRVFPRLGLRWNFPVKPERGLLKHTHLCPLNASLMNQKEWFIFTALGD